MDADLPDDLAQGLFAKPGLYPVAMRLSIVTSVAEISSLDLVSGLLTPWLGVFYDEAEYMNRNLIGRRGTLSSHVCCIGTGVFRIGFAIALIAMMVVALRPALAQTNYPIRQIRVIVAFAPGGIADVIARLVSQKLGEQFGQTIVVENRPGAGGTLGARIVSNAPPMDIRCL